MTQLKNHSCNEENAQKFAEWIKKRGGVLVWESINLSNPIASWSTPALTENGAPYGKPNWQSAKQPARHITSSDEIDVITEREVRRFRVGVRMGDNGLQLKVTDGGTRRIRAAVAKAESKYGDAWYAFDYWSQEAIILVPDKVITLTEWISKQS